MNEPRATELIHLLNQSSRLQKWEAASSAFKALLKQPSFNCDDLIPFFQAIYIAGRYRDAEAVFRALEKHESCKDKIAFLRDLEATFLFEQGNMDGAITCCKESIEQGGTGARLMTNLAACLLAKGELDEAFDILGKMRSAQANDPRINYLMGTQIAMETVNKVQVVDETEQMTAQVFQTMIPPFPELEDGIRTTLEVGDDGLWSCSMEAADRPRSFPIRSGVPVIAGTWNQQGLYVRMGTLRHAVPDQGMMTFELTAPSDFRVQRRQNVRIDGQNFVTAKVNAQEDKPLPVNVRDISASGIAFVTNKVVDIGKDIDITVEFADQTLETSAVTRRVLETGGSILVGAEFREDQKTLDKIARQIHKRQIELRRQKEN